MFLEKKIATENDCYKSGRKLNTVRGIVLHSVGCGQPDRNVFVKTFNVSKPNGRSVCVHAFLDDKGVTEILPLNMQCWGCGSGSNGSYNSSHIQFEMCEPAELYKGSYDVTKCKDYFSKSWDNAVNYCVQLCKKYNLSPDDIVSHKEAHALGYASNHGDPDHWWKHHNKTMNDFRTDVKKKLNANLITKTRLELNGKMIDVDAINVDGYNYIKLRDLSDDKIDVGYNDKLKVPYLKVR